MPSDFASHHPCHPSDWYSAVREYLLHLEGHRAPKTVRFYRVQLGQLADWCADEKIGFGSFGKRHMDRYLAFRAKKVAPTTLRHDAVSAKAFLKWCARYDLLDRNPLADYEVRSAPRPPKYMPTAEDVSALLGAARDFWDFRKNPAVRYHSPERRAFHRDRNTAVLLLLLDTAMRVGEALEMSVADYVPSEKRVTVRTSKGREPRVLPLSAPTVAALDAWLLARQRAMRDAETDENHLFISEFGGPVETRRFLRVLKGYVKMSGASGEITLHSLRRFSLNKLAKNNLLAAQAIAGHKNPMTTLIYTKIDPDFVREVHGQTAVVESMFGARRERRKRLF